MATKKSKSSNKSKKTESTKKGAAAKTAAKTEHEAPKTNKVEKSTNKSCLSGFFAKKYEGKESILTVFKDHKFYGALLGEIVGTMLLALLLFSVSLMVVMLIFFSNPRFNI